MRPPLLALVALVPVCLGIAACGGRNESSAARQGSRGFARAYGAPAAESGGAVPYGGYVTGDEDADAASGMQDRDDANVRWYGHESSTAERRAVAAVVRRYIAAAGAGNGAMACSMVYSSLAGSSELSRAVPQEYAPAPGSSALRGRKCPEVASMLFQLDRRRLVAEVATVQVVSLRVEGSRGWAVLGFRTMPERVIAVAREGRAWKIDGLLDSEML
jgi:hypothetical protein